MMVEQAVREDAVGRLVMIAILVLAALGFRSLGGSTTDVVESIRAGVSAATEHSPTSVRAELERAQADVDRLLARAGTTGADLASLRAEARATLELARLQTRRAITEAENQAGRDPKAIAELKAEATRRLAELRQSIAEALPKTN